MNSSTESMERQWRGRWINAGLTMGSPSDEVLPAPYLRKTFDCAQKPEKASVFLCGLGWHELYINNQKADDRVLAPAVSQFDKHVGFIEYDVTNLLQQGKNAVAVLLGNGWYNCQTHEVWSFDKAPWRDYPKLLCDIVVDGQTVAWSNASWKVHASPITFDALRNGQYYDARLETADFASPELDDSEWTAAGLAVPPGGRVIRETAQPCKVMHTYPAVSKRFVTSVLTTYDFGVNLAGWCRIKVRGETGAQVEIRYSELADPVSGNINTQEFISFIKSGPFQTDRYILKGDAAEEVYEPSFTYHGFRYAQIYITGKAEVVDIQACFVHTAFDEMGCFESSDAILNTLQRNTLQSFKSNFVGIPTDCPHREKNGWTGDAALAAETGLWNFDMVPGFAHFTRIVADTQRPDGQLPGIAPSGGWGYNWGSGPAWDTVLFEYPYQTYVFTGNIEPIAKYYDNFKLYIEYCASRAEDDLIDFGLGDWCHWDRAQIAPVEVTSSGYYYQNVLRTAFFADRLGKTDDAAELRALASRIRHSFVKKFANPDGSFADGSLTATAAAIYFGLIDGWEAEKSAATLVKQVREQQHKANFGILGAKYTLRVLADHGYADDALEMITQQEFPGWGYQVRIGATSLWENWNGKDSRNHIMFGDISAWMYQYLGGIRPMKETPGFRKFKLQPCFVKKLSHIKACHRSPWGMIRSQWQKQAGAICYEFDIPSGSCADIILPGQTICDAVGHGEVVIQ